MAEMASTPFRRDQLAQFLKSPELIRKFENLSHDVVVNLPENVDAVAQTAAEAKDDAANARDAADAAQAGANQAQLDADAAQEAADRAERDVFGLKLQPLAVPVPFSVTDASAIIAARIFNR